MTKHNGIGGVPDAMMDLAEVPDFVGVHPSWVYRLVRTNRLRTWRHPDFPSLTVVSRPEMEAWRARTIEQNKVNSRNLQRFRANLPPTLPQLEAKVGARAARYLAHIHSLYGHEHRAMSKLARQEGVSRERVRQVVAQALKKLL